MIRARRAALVLALLFTAPRPTPATTRARIYRGSHEREVSLESFRRGIFFGSCGPATKSLKWEFSFTLHGDGPVFHAPAIELKDGALRPIPVRAGTIELSGRRVTIAIAIGRGGRTAPFPYNGIYRDR